MVGLGTAVAGLVLAIVLGRIAVMHKERALELWALAAGAYSVRVLLESAVRAIGTQSAALTLISYALGVASAFLMLAGTIRFAGSTPSRTVLLGGGIVVLGCSTALLAAGASPVVAAAPAFVAQGVARIAAGAVWLRRRTGGGWNKFIGAVLVLWGVHALDYPLIAGDPFLAEAGYQTSGLLAALTAVGILLAYFESVRTRLAASEARYRSLFRDSASVMLLVDPSDGSIKDANAAAERFYGWSREQLASMRVTDINTLSPDEVKAEMERARTRNKNHFEFRHRLANGEIRDVEVYSGPVSGPDSEQWLYSIIHDVTDKVEAQRALEESERRYRTLFEDSAQPMVLVAPDDARIVEANAAAERFYGWSREQLRAMTIADVSADDPLDVVLEEVRKSIEERQQVGTYRHKTASGDVRDVEVHATPIAFGGEPFLFTIVVDITDRKRAERELERYRVGLENEVEERTAQLEEAYEQLARANEAKDDFLRSMSHELRTPLNSVIGFSRLLEQELPGPLNDEQKVQVRMIRNAGLHLLALVDDVLDLSRIEDGRMSVELVEVDLGVLAEEAVAAVRPLAEEKGLALEVEARPGTLCRTDPQLVRQIIWNLLSNAIKYTERGSVHVTAARHETTVRLSVADTGPGMTAGQIEQAFEAFTRFRPPGDSSGTGLGLAISRRLAELLGGRITAQSAPGEGSVFILELPCSGGYPAEGDVPLDT